MTTSDGRGTDVAVIVVAAGGGVRLGPGPPKALRALGGEPLVVHAVRRIAAAAGVGHVVVAAPPDLADTVRALVSRAIARGGRGGRPSPPDIDVVPGGPDRQRSVAAALAAVPSDADIVLVHDAARPLTPTSLAERVAAAVRDGHEAVIPVLPVPDTVTRVDPAGACVGHLDRSTLRVVQTPQGFRRSVLVRAHAVAGDVTATDDAGLVARIGVPVHTVPGSEWAMKITTPVDLSVAEALLSATADDR